MSRSVFHVGLCLIYTAIQNISRNTYSDKRLIGALCIKESTCSGFCVILLWLQPFIWTSHHSTSFSFLQATSLFISSIVKQDPDAGLCFKLSYLFTGIILGGCLAGEGWPSDHCV